MTKKTAIVLYSILIVYCLVLFYFAVLGREQTSMRIVWLDLLEGYTNPKYNSVSNGLLNMCLFIPVGAITAFAAKKYRIWKSVLVGLLISGVIEFSQLIWKRGVFDVDDFFNGAMGASVGGLLVLFTMKIRKKTMTRRI